jgi:hypothetical protein
VMPVHNQVVNSIAIELLHHLYISRENPIALMQNWVPGRN